MQETVCPADLLLSKDEDTIQPSPISYISIPVGEPEPLSNPDKPPKSASEFPKTEENLVDDGNELHDILFHSIGLERVPECWRKAQEKLASAESNDSAKLAEMPARDIERELIGVYFRQFHPICPAVDETEFLTWYRAPKRYHTSPPPLMQLVRFSILFAASSHVDEELLRRSPFASVKQAQKSFFIFAKTLYHRLALKFEGAEGLAQSALLLSYWSPYDSSKEVNSYWVDEAIRHAVAGAFCDPTSTHRKRIIWWCCIIRNRMISFGLRRRNRLDWRPDGRLPDTADFGDEVSNPHFTSTESKVRMTQTFALLCSLTRVMVEGARIECRDDSTYKSFPNARQTIDIMEKVKQLDEELELWRTRLEHLYATVQTWNVPHTDLVIFHLLRLMHQFAISLLYEPFLRLSESAGPRTWFIKNFALLKIRGVSTNTAAITASMLQLAKPKDLPIIIPPWIILPIALHLIQLSRQQEVDVRTETVRHLRYLMQTLYRLTCRFEGAGFIIKIVDAIIVGVREATDATLADRAVATAAAWRAQEFVSRDDNVLFYALDVIQKGLAEEIVQV